MGESLNRAINEIERKERSNRRLKLLQLIERILSKSVNSEKTILTDIFNQNGPRYNYVSPLNRGTFNYGYMDRGEFPMAGTPYIGEL